MADQELLRIPFEQQLFRDHRAIQALAEVGPEIEIVIALDEEQPGAVIRQPLQGFEQGHVIGEDHMAIAEPELENIAQQEQGIEIFLAIEKIEQPPVIFVPRVAQVGI